LLKNNKLLSNLDFSLISTILALFTLGMISIASATDVPTLGISREVIVQFISFAIGIGLIVLILRVDYNVLGESYKILYVVSILLLLLVYVPGLGIVRFNARSWIDIGIIDLQTSEIAKIGFIIAFSKYIEKNRMNGLTRLKA
jgi:rod shape determining protein RodA